MPEQTALTPAPTSLVTAPQPFSAGFHTQPAFDVLDLLTEGGAAQDRLKKLRLRSRDAHMLIPQHEEIRQATLAKIDATNNLTRLTAHPQNFGFNLKPGDRRVDDAQKLVAKLDADAKRLTELAEVRAAAWRAASGALANVEDWLRSGKPGGTVLQEHEIEIPPLARGESGLLDAIENRRRRVRELRADLHRIESAPFPSSYAKQRMRASVEALARAPDVTNLIEHDTAIIWPTQRVQSEVFAEQRALGFHEAVDVVGLLAFLLKPTLISALDALIDAESDSADTALTHEDRARRAAEILGDILEHELIESAMVFAAWEQGLPVEHRGDINNPAALLGLRVVTAPHAATNGPSTTPDAYDFVLAGR